MTYITCNSEGEFETERLFFFCHKKSVLSIKVLCFVKTMTLKVIRKSFLFVVGQQQQKKAH